MELLLPPVKDFTLLFSVSVVYPQSTPSALAFLMTVLRQTAVGLPIFSFDSNGSPRCVLISFD